ncbi:unnamed protein product [Thlaspi arvense]|uniref:Calcineurin B-like protein n=1 Tax=Thlaspi arvense TaxID=13288 RepID=A0AAU9SY69_THLAR|nr:unnamed protein product [Thlaspi arvense]
MWKFKKMGCVCSKQIGGRRHENISLLASQTVFSEAEVEVLHDLFLKLTSCLSNQNLITKIFVLFDMRNDGGIDFGEFVHSLNVFHPNSSQRDKAIFAFRLYDTRQTGFIEPEEVKEMIIDVLEESELMLTESIVDSIVSKTFEEADCKKDGKIDLEEWENFVATYPLTLKNMTIPFLKDLSRLFPGFLQ